LVINFDEWGGFYDHVAPPYHPIPEAVRKAAMGSPPKGKANYTNLVDGLGGFRVPALMISPLARRHHVSHMPFDHTSILKMIEWRFGLAPLTISDRTTNNMAHALDFRQPKNLDAPRFDVPKGPHEGGVFSLSCSPTKKRYKYEFQELHDRAKELGFRM
jgi:phospholipase C